MAAMSDYLEGEIRKHIFRTGSFTKPTVLAVALFTAAPSDSGGGTEVSGGGYARVQRDPLDANWTGVSATDGLTDNAAALTFPVPTANWVSSTMSFASARRPGSCSAKFVSCSPSNEPTPQAANFCGQI